MSTTNSFIHDNPKRQASLENNLAFHSHRNFSGISHGDKNTRGSKLVAVVINMVGLDTCKVRNCQTRVKRTCLYDTCRKKPPAVQPFEKAYTKVCKTWDLQKLFNELVCIIFALFFLIFRNIGINLFLNLENGIVKIKPDFAHGAFHIPIPFFEDYHGNIKVFSIVNLLIYYESV